LLRYSLRQIYLQSLGRYYLPLPKLSVAQMSFLSGNLEERGFRVQRDQRVLRAKAPSITLAIDPEGLARSSGDLMDAIAPAIPELLAFTPENRESPQDGRAVYMRAKKVRGRSFELQLFTRMESLRTWTEMRREGVCALAPDEKEQIVSFLASSQGSVECITDYVCETSSPLQFGRRQYYRSTVPVEEFRTSLRTLTESSSRNSYLPRESVLRVEMKGRPELPGLTDSLGEWCYIRWTPKTSNS